MKNSFYLFIITLFFIPSLFSEVNWDRSNSCAYPRFENVDLVNQLIKDMTVEEKVGQIIQGDLDFITPEDVKEFKIGSVLNGGNTAPNGDKYSSVDDWKALSKKLYEASPIYKGIRVPVLWGTDAVHGHNNVIGATLFPHNIGLGATQNEELLRNIGEVIALEVLSTGVAWTFAPTIAVPQNDSLGRTYEGFSENPILVSKLGKAMINGLQGEGETFLDNNHVIATAKHFLGDGGTFEGVDQGDTRITEIELREIHGHPYFEALDACAQTVMASFNSWNGEKMHGNQYFLTDILKEKMEFDGFVVGDWNGHGQIPNCTNSNCAQAINAGVDMFMVPENWKDLLKNTITQVQSSEISSLKLDDAVRRILLVKSRMGLLNGRVPHNFPKNMLGHPDHIAIARQAVRESLVLLKNNNKTLPINPDQHIGVIGAAANKISSQTGGWTITWQGRENSNSDFMNTQTIYEAINAAVLESGGSIEFSSDGNFLEVPDLVIGIFGEEPYAEMLGDLKDVAFAPTDAGYLTQLESISLQKIPTVSIFLSGRPLVVNEYLNLSDAFVAAWLPGTAVEGIGDVIFTKNDEVHHDFMGKLSFSWPKNKNQTSLNFKDTNYDPLFPFGYGLSYLSESYLEPVNVDSSQVINSAINIFLGAASIPRQEFIVSGSQPELVMEDDFETANKNIQITRFDYLRQDDSKNIIFKSSVSLNAYGINAESPIDLSLMNSPYYEVIMRVNSVQNASLFFGAGCGDNCQGSVNIPIQQAYQWTSINIPLSCMEKDGLDVSNIQTQALFMSPDNINFDLHSVIIKDGQMDGQPIPCQ